MTSIKKKKKATRSLFRLLKEFRLKKTPNLIASTYKKIGQFVKHILDSINRNETSREYSK